MTTDPSLELQVDTALTNTHDDLNTVVSQIYQTDPHNDDAVLQQEQPSEQMATTLASQQQMTQMLLSLVNDEILAALVAAQYSTILPPLPELDPLSPQVSEENQRHEHYLREQRRVYNEHVLARFANIKRFVDMLTHDAIVSYLEANPQCIIHSNHAEILSPEQERVLFNPILEQIIFDPTHLNFLLREVVITFHNDPMLFLYDTLGFDPELAHNLVEQAVFLTQLSMLPTQYDVALEYTLLQLPSHWYTYASFQTRCQVFLQYYSHFFNLIADCRDDAYYSLAQQVHTTQFFLHEQQRALLLGPHVSDNGQYVSNSDQHDLHFIHSAEPFPSVSPYLEVCDHWGLSTAPLSAATGSLMVTPTTTLQTSLVSSAAVLFAQTLFDSSLFPVVLDGGEIDPHGHNSTQQQPHDVALAPAPTATMMAKKGATKLSINANKGDAAKTSITQMVSTDDLSPTHSTTGQSYVQQLQLEQEHMGQQEKDQQAHYISARPTLLHHQQEHQIAQRAPVTINKPAYNALLNFPNTINAIESIPFTTPASLVSTHYNTLHPVQIELPRAHCNVRGPSILPTIQSNNNNSSENNESNNTTVINNQSDESNQSQQQQQPNPISFNLPNNISFHQPIYPPDLFCHFLQTQTSTALKSNTHIVQYVTEMNNPNVLLRSLSFSPDFRPLLCFLQDLSLYLSKYHWEQFLHVLYLYNIGIITRSMMLSFSQDVLLDPELVARFCAAIGASQALQRDRLGAFHRLVLSGVYQLAPQDFNNRVLLRFFRGDSTMFSPMQFTQCWTRSACSIMLLTICKAFILEAEKFFFQTYHQKSKFSIVDMDLCELPEPPNTITATQQLELQHSHFNAIPISLVSLTHDLLPQILAMHPSPPTTMVQDTTPLKLKQQYTKQHAIDILATCLAMKLSMHTITYGNLPNNSNASPLSLSRRLLESVDDHLIAPYTYEPSDLIEYYQFLQQISDTSNSLLTHPQCRISPSYILLPSYLDYPTMSSYNHLTRQALGMLSSHQNRYHHWVMVMMYITIYKTMVSITLSNMNNLNCNPMKQQMLIQATKRDVLGTSTKDLYTLHQKIPKYSPHAQRAHKSVILPPPMHTSGYPYAIHDTLSVGIFANPMNNTTDLFPKNTPQSMSILCNLKNDDNHSQKSTHITPIQLMNPHLPDNQLHHLELLDLQCEIDVMVGQLTSTMQYLIDLHAAILTLPPNMHHTHHLLQPIPTRHADVLSTIYSSTNQTDSLSNISSSVTPTAPRSIEMYDPEGFKHQDELLRTLKHFPYLTIPVVVTRLEEKIAMLGQIRGNSTMLWPKLFAAQNITPYSQVRAIRHADQERRTAKTQILQLQELYLTTLATNGGEEQQVDPQTTIGEVVVDPTVYFNTNAQIVPILPASQKDALIVRSLQCEHKTNEDPIDIPMLSEDDKGNDATNNNNNTKHLQEQTLKLNGKTLITKADMSVRDEVNKLCFCDQAEHFVTLFRHMLWRIYQQQQTQLTAYYTNNQHPHLTHHIPHSANNQFNFRAITRVVEEFNVERFITANSPTLLQTHYPVEQIFVHNLTTPFMQTTDEEYIALYRLCMLFNIPVEAIPVVYPPATAHTTILPPPMHRLIGLNLSHTMSDSFYLSLANELHAPIVFALVDQHRVQYKLLSNAVSFSPGSWDNLITNENHSCRDKNHNVEDELPFENPCLPYNYFSDKDFVTNDKTVTASNILNVTPSLDAYAAQHNLQLSPACACCGLHTRCPREYQIRYTTPSALVHVYALSFLGHTIMSLPIANAGIILCLLQFITNVIWKQCRVSTELIALAEKVIIPDLLTQWFTNYMGKSHDKARMLLSFYTQNGPRSHYTTANDSAALVNATRLAESRGADVVDLDAVQNINHGDHPDPLVSKLDPHDPTYNYPYVEFILPCPTPMDTIKYATLIKQQLTTMCPTTQSRSAAATTFVGENMDENQQQHDSMTLPVDEYGHNIQPTQFFPQYFNFTHINTLINDIYEDGPMRNVITYYAHSQYSSSTTDEENVVMFNDGLDLDQFFPTTEVLQRIHDFEMVTRSIPNQGGIDSIDELHNSMDHFDPLYDDKKENMVMELMKHVCTNTSFGLSKMITESVPFFTATNKSLYQLADSYTPLELRQQPYEHHTSSLLFNYHTIDPTQSPQCTFMNMQPSTIHNLPMLNIQIDIGDAQNNNHNIVTHEISSHPSCVSHIIKDETLEQEQIISSNNPKFHHDGLDTSKPSPTFTQVTPMILTPSLFQLFQLYFALYQRIYPIIASQSAHHQQAASDHDILNDIAAEQEYLSSLSHDHFYMDVSPEELEQLKEDDRMLLRLLKPQKNVLQSPTHLKSYEWLTLHLLHDNITPYQYEVECLALFGHAMAGTFCNMQHHCIQFVKQLYNICSNQNGIKAVALYDMYQLSLRCHDLQRTKFSYNRQNSDIITHTTLRQPISAQITLPRTTHQDVTKSYQAYVAMCLYEFSNLPALARFVHFPHSKITAMGYLSNSVLHRHEDPIIIPEVYYDMALNWLSAESSVVADDLVDALCDKVSTYMEQLVTLVNQNAEISKILPVTTTTDGNNDTLLATSSDALLAPPNTYQQPTITALVQNNFLDQPYAPITQELDKFPIIMNRILDNDFVFDDEDNISNVIRNHSFNGVSPTTLELQARVSTAHTRRPPFLLRNVTNALKNLVSARHTTDLYANTVHQDKTVYHYYTGVHKPGLTSTPHYHITDGTSLDHAERKLKELPKEQGNVKHIIASSSAFHRLSPQRHSDFGTDTMLTATPVIDLKPSGGRKRKQPPVATPSITETTSSSSTTMTALPISILSTTNIFQTNILQHQALQPLIQHRPYYPVPAHRPPTELPKKYQQVMVKLLGKQQEQIQVGQELHEYKHHTQHLQLVSQAGSRAEATIVDQGNNNESNTIQDNTNENCGIIDQM